ncbi:MAG: DUF433 domain-containing protein [Desulfurococcales archaeon]|nr:DUF433 domain-containing protein [Desulfurococcales archaeon]
MVVIRLFLIKSCWLVTIEDNEIAEATKRITVDPKVMGGKPVIKGTRTLVSDALEMLSAGMSIEDVLREYSSFLGR